MPKTLIKKYIIVTVAALIFSMAGAGYIWAQSAQKIERKADESFKNKNYYNAAILYSTILYETPISETTESLVYPAQSYTKSPIHKIKESSINRVTYKLADSYRLYEHYQDAALQYQQYIASKDPQYPLAELWYGYCLLANNDPQKAVTAFNAFLKKYHNKDVYVDMAKQGIASCNLIISNKSLKPVATITKMQATSSEDGSNFALEKMNESEYWFSSSRNEINKKQQKIYPLRLYKGNFSKGNITKAFEQIADDVNMAANSFSSDGNTVFLTGWKEEVKSGVQPFAIYYMKRPDVHSKWSNPILLPAPINVKGYQSKQPYISQDGKFLLFSSNQPGGIGKYDIWMVAMEGEKPVGKALNLGSNINTQGNDVTPFYNAAESKLTFSTDGRLGMGGLDIYETTGSISQNQWKDSISHLGAPYNSVKDDEYFKMYGTDTGYLSSDRFSSCCLEIFKTVKIKNIDSIKINTIKKDTVNVDTVKQPILAVKIPDSEPVVTSTILEKESVEKHFMDSINAITFIRRNVYYNFASAKVRNEDFSQLDEIVSVLEKNPELNILVASFTDCKGSLEANIRLSRKRSESVRWYLMSKGIKTSRINIDFFGKEHFIMMCKEDTTYNSGKQLANRRSDLIITKGSKPKWIPSGRELDITKINPDSNYHSPEFYAITRKLKLDVDANIGQPKIDNSANSIPQNSTIVAKTEIKKVGPIVPDKQTSAYLRTVETNPNRINKPDAQVEKVPTLVEKEKEKKVNAPVGNKMQMIEMLDMSPRLKESEIINEMTKRIPKKPLQIYSTSEFVRIDLYDNGVFDYDTVSVIFNKQILVYKELLQVNKPISFFVKLDNDQSKNEMIFFAENLGLTPPNSALMVITDADNKRTEVSVSSDLYSNVVIYFIKLNKGQKK
jgi:outer membrane protein OmpA-like peptidoglycan-associated protein